MLFVLLAGKASEGRSDAMPLPSILAGCTELTRKLGCIGPLSPAQKAQAETHQRYHLLDMVCELWLQWLRRPVRE